ncbi:MAG TPA: M1 family metallopeptidase [Candidatus Margulisiibacteriota bacterium]|nr:M1 family metallopeptidase [Candidatus Margulisiibacteriota bacterium]
MRIRSVVAALSMIAVTHRAGAAPLSPRIANYRITANYNGREHSILGHETLTWRNTTREPAADLYFHLYLNAFANSQSSFMRALGDAWVEWARWHPDGWGYIMVNAIRIAGADLTPRVQFVHPDDDNLDDRTVFRVPLDKPVRAGATVEVEIDFVAKLPKLFARSGYAGPFAMVAQWFPKIGVYQDGAWNCHQYHATTEFFADFGVYDVTLTVPGNGVVGASGVLQESHDDGAGTQTVHFVAEDVHDFAWTIDPRFRVVEEEAGSTHLKLLVQPNHAAQAARYMGAAREALQRYEEWIGPYPYPQLTIVDPGPGAMRAGGMEYPTLITVGTAWWMPGGVRLPESVTVHEFGHQYWYGMVASNEFEEAWLDEGINSYLEGKIMDAGYGRGSYVDVWGVHLDSVTLHRLRYLTSAQHDPMTRYAWQFLDRSSYGAVTYSKTALVLETLDRCLGSERLRAGLAVYFDRWRFRHPRGDDFLNTIRQSIGEDLNWYFDQVLSNTGLLDYAVTQVTAEDAPGFSGYAFRDGRVGEAVTPPPDAQKRYHNEVVVERLGTVQMPVDVQIVFDDGTVTNEHWDGRDRWRRFEYTGSQRVEWAIVDPNRTMPLDFNRLNNSRMRESGTRGIVRIATRWGFWLQNVLWALTGS